MPVIGPTQGASKGMSSEWVSRPGLARLIRIVVTIAPVILTIGISYALARVLPPVEPGRDRLLWWGFLLAFTMTTLYAFDRLFRRFAPLATLLRISLVFPDEAPSRYRTALRAGTTRELERKVEAIANGGAAFDDETTFAVQMLEMVAALSEHDRLTRGHCERVRAYVDLIMEEMGIDGEDADRLRWAALLHDLGKLMVPQWILTKPDRPTDSEWEILKTHAAEGQRLAAPLEDWLGEWIRTIGEHHERWDGHGYPNGLRTNDIHLGARIVAVADTYDVITSSRSYKDPIPAADARTEIAKNAGSQFDPRVVRAFLSIGIGRLRLIAGPMAWITSLFGLSSTPVGVAGSVATAALTVATVGVVTAPVASSEQIETASPPPSTVGFAAEDTTPTTSLPTTTLRLTTTTTSTTAPTSSITSAPPIPDVAAPPRPTTTSRPVTTTAAPTTLASTSAPTSAQPSTTSTAPPTTAAPIELAINAAANTFTLAASAATGDEVGTLLDTNETAGLVWSSVDPEMLFTVSPNGTVSVTNQTAFLEAGAYGTTFTQTVSVAAPDGRSATGSFSVEIAPLPNSAEGLLITEIGLSAVDSDAGFVEVANPTANPITVRTLALQTATPTTSKVYRLSTSTGILTLGPNETMVLSAGPASYGVPTIEMLDQRILKTSDGQIGVQLYASDQYLDGAGLPPLVESVATTGITQPGFGSGTKLQPLPVTDELIAFARRGSGLPMCSDSGSNAADFEVRLQGSFAVPTPGASACTTPRPAPQPGTGLIISEFAATGLIFDSDWIEVSNPTAAPIDLTNAVLGTLVVGQAGPDKIPLAGLKPDDLLQPGEQILVASGAFVGPADTLHPQLSVGVGTIWIEVDGTEVDNVEVSALATDLPEDRFGTSSWTRLFGGTQDTGNHRQDFQFTQQSTPGS